MQLPVSSQGSTWGQRGTLYGGEWSRDAAQPIRNEAGGCVVRLWSGGSETGGARTNQGDLTTFRLETVSWLECRPLAALDCSLQRPNAGTSQSHDAAGLGGAQLTLGQFLTWSSDPRCPGGWRFIAAAKWQVDENDLLSSHSGIVKTGDGYAPGLQRCASRLWGRGDRWQ